MYVRALTWEFRWSFILGAILVEFGAMLYAITPSAQLSGQKPDLLTSSYASWMALLAQPMFNPPERWYLALLQSLYPIFGFILIGEGVVRFALLMISKRHGEKEWMRVMASTYRDHVILCGLGHLGIRVLQQLTERGIEVVAVERDPDGKFITAAKALGTPVLIRDMKEDQALVDAGIESASSIIIATNDDMANIEVALDARRLNPKIRVIMRLFEQDIARKITGALTIDMAFSSSALAAPMVAAMSLGTKIMSNLVIAGVPYVVAEVPLREKCAIDGKRVDQVEIAYTCRVLAILKPDGSKLSPPSPAETVACGHTLIVHVEAAHLPNIAGAATA